MHLMVRLIEPERRKMSLRTGTGKMDGCGSKIAGCTCSRPRREATEDWSERDSVRVTEIEQAYGVKSLRLKTSSTEIVFKSLCV